MMHDELYKILGVAKDATRDQIKAAYRTLAKQHHPDRGGDMEQFKRVASAYEVLENSERRLQYDRNGTTASANAWQQKKTSILQAVVDQKADEYVLNPLLKLAKIEKEIEKARAALEKKIGAVETDIKKLSKSKKSEEVMTVLGVLVGVKSALETHLGQAKFEHAICQELTAEFKKACEILKRKPDEVSSFVRPNMWGGTTASTTGGY